MKCPVCKTECEENTSCHFCGFEVNVPMFINEKEADIWLKSIVIPYRELLLQKQNRAALISIEELNISNRAYYPIKEAGITTVSSLIEKTYDELNNVCGLSGAAWYDLVVTLKKRGYTIKGVPPHLQEQKFSEALSVWDNTFNISALQEVNSFANKWLEIFQKTPAHGYPFSTPEIRGEFYRDFEAWGCNPDIDSLKQDYRDIFNYPNTIAFLDDTEVFVKNIIQVNNIEMLSVLICAKWRYRISRDREYTPELKEWCIAAFERLVTLSEKQLIDKA